MEFITENPVQNKAIIRQLLENWQDKKCSGALVLGLTGELGSGKTTFSQALAKELGVKERVLSPTFVIMKRYLIGQSDNLATGQLKNFYHLDCYRIAGAKDLEELGFAKIIKDPKNLVAIEWSEKIKNILPKDTIWIKFEHLGEERRKIEIVNHKTQNI